MRSLLGILRGGLGGASGVTAMSDGDGDEYVAVGEWVKHTAPERGNFTLVRNFALVGCPAVFQILYQDDKIGTPVLGSARLIRRAYRKHTLFERMY
jgi:hypothetical protein